MTCANCTHWLTKEITTYSDGSEVVHFQAADGMGRCGALGIDTLASFSCASFSEGITHVIVRDHKRGSPWQFWRMDACPDCTGRGNQGEGSCHRCAGTGKVRHYDDGYVGEERTRMHPKEREQASVVKNCQQCARVVDKGWVACPYCGSRLIELPAETEHVSMTDSMHVR